MKYAQRFFSYPHEKPQQVSSKHIEMIHFNHNALLAFSALIIDFFITSPSRRHNSSAELILANLDLLKAYPHYPFPQSTPQNFLTSANYLHQLCLAATTPTLLLWLMRSISLALKRLTLEEMIQNYSYYTFIFNQPIDFKHLQSLEPHQLNRYVGFVLRQVFKFDFIESETADHKTLPKVSYASASKLSTTGLITHRNKEQYLVGAIVGHADLFKLIMNSEHCQFLCRELQHTQVILPPKHITPSAPIYLEHYAAVKQQLMRLALSQSELEQRYFDTLDRVIEKQHDSTHRFLSIDSIHTGNKRYFKSISQNVALFNAAKPFSARLYEALEDALCQLIALEMVPDTALSHPFGLTNDEQYKTFLTQESDNCIMTSI